MSDCLLYAYMSDCLLYALAHRCAWVYIFGSSWYTLAHRCAWAYVFGLLRCTLAQSCAWVYMLAFMIECMLVCPSAESRMGKYVIAMVLWIPRAQSAHGACNIVLG